MTDYRSVLERDLRRVGPPAFTLDDVARRRDRRQRNRRIGTAVLALAVAAAAIGGVVRAFRVGETPRPANLPSTADAWSRVPLEPATNAHQVWVNAITPGGPGLVAAGFADDQAAVWTSSDGRTWSRVPSELGGGQIRDVTAGGPGFVAVGAEYSSPSVDAPERLAGLTWTSTDGLTWSRAPDDPVFRDAWVVAVTAGGPGLVAVGTTREDGPQAWYSSDGMTWERASMPPVPPDVARETNVFMPGKVAGREHVVAWMRDVALVGDRLVAVGMVGIRCWDRPRDSDCYFEQMVMWTSTDGTAWTEVALGPDVFPRPSTVSSMAVGPNGVVAVGVYRDEEPGAWISADGLDWRRVPSGQDAFVSNWFGFGPGGGLNSVAAGSGGYVAVGGDGICGGGGCPSSEAAVWTSIDGESWIRVPTGSVFQVGGTAWVNAKVVTAWGSRFVAAGEYGGYDGGTAIWISEP